MHPFIQYHFNSLLMTGKERWRRKRAVEKYENDEMNNPGDYGSVNCLHYYKCIFFHIPKAAGLSVSKTLFGSLGPCHITYDWYVENFGRHTVNAYYKFTFVRNPWDRLHSVYFFLKKGGVNAEDEKFAEKYLNNVNSFEDFVMNWLSEDKLDMYWHLMPQYKFITSAKDENKIMTDFLGRFENVEKDFGRITSILGFKNVKLENVNDNKEKISSYINDYSEEMIDKVADLYGQDIELLKYNFK
jgi:hypothetical protein